MRQSWTKKKVRDAILGLHQTGSAINSFFVQKNHQSLYNGACRCFGSWGKAIKAAGLDYSGIKKNAGSPVYWTRERVVGCIIEVYKNEGKINSNHVQINYAALYQRAIRRFGSWGAAVKAAGLDYKVVRVRKPFRTWSKKAIIAEVRSRWANGLSINTMAVMVVDRGLYCAALRYFGEDAWRKILKKIGVHPRDINPRRIWNNAKVVDEIQRLFSLGVPLYAYYLSNNGYLSLVAGGLKSFGSWKKAIEAAGLDYTKVRAVRHNYWTKNRVVSEIRKLEKLGVRLSIKATQKNRADLVGAAIKYFDHWDVAVEAAGIDYHKHCQVWSTTAWLRKLNRVQVRTLKQKAKTLANKMPRKHRKRNP